MEMVHSYQNILMCSTNPALPSFVFHVGSTPKTLFRANIFDWDVRQHPKVSNYGGKSRLYHVLNEDLANPKFVQA